jgi:hypothetical protein
VAGGRLAELKPGQIAISRLEASSGVMGAGVGARITVYLPDGTPYRATVSAIYQRSLALGDLLIPASAADGHTGAPAGYSEIPISGGTQRELAALAVAHPGIQLARRLALSNTTWWQRRRHPCAAAISRTHHDILSGRHGQAGKF